MSDGSEIDRKNACNLRETSVRYSTQEQLEVTGVCRMETLYTVNLRMCI